MLDIFKQERLQLIFMLYKSDQSEATAKKDGLVSHLRAPAMVNLAIL